LKSTVYPTFPYPVIVCGDKYAFTKAERDFIAGLEMIDNSGNTMSKDDRILDRDELSAVRAFVDQQILAFKKGLLRIGDDVEIYVTQSWANRAGPNEYHPRHKHPNSVISGVMYLDDNSDEKLPPIRFHRTLEMFPLDFVYEGLNEFNATCREIYPQQGMLVLFPSLLEHDVGRNDSSRARTSLSFNTYVRGTIGGKRSLTEVRIS
jgi:uncharacterized protein (TIGR02466 family)